LPQLRKDCELRRVINNLIEANGRQVGNLQNKLFFVENLFEGPLVGQEIYLI
jgi:hypothetical protein